MAIKFLKNKKTQHLQFCYLSVDYFWFYSLFECANQIYVILSQALPWSCNKNTTLGPTFHLKLLCHLIISKGVDFFWRGLDLCILVSPTSHGLCLPTFLCSDLSHFTLFNHKQRNKHYTKRIFHLSEPSFLLGWNYKWRLNISTRALFMQKGKYDFLNWFY